MPAARVGAAASRRRTLELRALVAGVTLVTSATVAHAIADRAQTRGLNACRVHPARRPALDRQCSERTASPADRMAPEGDAVSSVFSRPVEGGVSSAFGWRRSPFGGEWQWHPGIDIRGAYGTLVHATASGQVLFTGRAGGYGLMVVLGHGVVTTRYAHLSQSWVRLGQTVLRGDALGTLGGTGNVTGPHLHYEVRLAGEPLDPECFLIESAGSMLPHDRYQSRSCTLARSRLAGRSPALAARGAPTTKRRTEVTS
jgi:murein DD-endopeptidase MepM/ murein hydrolase activator NlpD